MSSHLVTGKWMFKDTSAISPSHEACHPWLPPTWAAFHVFFLISFAVAEWLAPCTHSSGPPSSKGTSRLPTAPHSSPAPHGSAPNIIAGWVDVRQGQPASRASLGASSQLDNEGEANAPQVPFVASDRSVRFAMPGAESSVRIRSLLVNMFQELDSIQSLWAFGPGLEVGS